MRLCVMFLVAACSAAALAAEPVYVVDVAVPDRATVDELSRDGYIIDAVRDGVARIYASQHQLDALVERGLSFIHVDSPPAKTPAGYRSYETMTQQLEIYAATYSDICRLETLGQSSEGRELWALLISRNPAIEEDEPEFKYVATMHGDEALNVELMMRFIDMLLTGYGDDGRITDLIDTTAISIVPLMNPDGYHRNSRFNANTPAADLNRTFPFYPEELNDTLFLAGLPDMSGREPEVAHIMNWTIRNSFVLSANLHTGALLVNYPYDDDEKGSVDSPSPDDLLFEDISRRYSTHNLPMWNSPYFANGISNGAEWYSVDGGMQDWNYRFVACNEVTLELSEVKAPPVALLDAFWGDNAESLLSYLEAVHIGARGLVRDALTGIPLWAEVRVAGNDQPVFTDRDVGDYHRMLLPGTYDLTVWASGRMSATVSDVVVTDGAATRVDVDLERDPDTFGDVNGDGVINAIDVQLVVNAALEFFVLYNCDLDGGGVAATDVQFVVNRALGVM